MADKPATDDRDPRVVEEVVVVEEIVEVVVEEPEDGEFEFVPSGGPYKVSYGAAPPPTSGGAPATFLDSEPTEPPPTRGDTR